MPAIASTPLRDCTDELMKQNPKNPKMRVAFFSGCNIDFVFPNTGKSVFKVLQNLGVEVIYPQKQNCCGKPIIGSGDLETARKIAKENIQALEETNADYIVAACPTCTETLEKTYVELFKDDSQWLARSKVLSKKIREFSQFVFSMYKEMNKLDDTVNNEGKIKITYHDSCHMKRGLNIYKEPRVLLKNTKKYNFVEMQGCDQCCGMAGAFGMKYKDISLRLLSRKLENIKDSQADIVAVACPACMMQIGGGLDK